MEELVTLEMKGSCHMCGKCCEAIHIGHSPKDIKETADRARMRGLDDTNSDAIFIEQHWEPITLTQAYEINPYLKENAESDPLMKKAYEEQLHFYTCKQHDKETRKCSIHDIRPQVCSGYPWYGREPHDLSWYSAECGYRVDVEGGDKDDRKKDASPMDDRDGVQVGAGS